MKNLIKKLMILALALVVALSMCACGDDDRDDDDDDDDRGNAGTSVLIPRPVEPTMPSETIPVETEPEMPAVPTAEELEILEQFEQISYDLTWTRSSEELGALYEQLLNIDKSIIEKWAGTEYEPTEHYGIPISWDYDALLAGFAILENVALHQTRSNTDFVGNVNEVNNRVEWNYDTDGRVVYVENSFDEFKMIVTNPSSLSGSRQETVDENGFVTEIRYGYDNNGTFQTNYLVKRTLDENGNVLLETVTDTNGNSYDINYSYDDQGNLTAIAYDPGFYSYAYYYTYDEAGRVIRSENVMYMEQYATDVVYRKNIMEYTYDENGVLSSGIRSQEEWEYEIDWIKHGWMDYEYFVSNEYPVNRTQDAYVFTCDDQGRVTHITVTPGDQQILAGYGAGTTGTEAQYAAIDFEITYGDYYIHTYPTAE